MWNSRVGTRNKHMKPHIKYLRNLTNTTVQDDINGENGENCE